MISRSHRFHGYNSLRQVYGRGQTTRCNILALKYLSNPQRDLYRIAVVVSRKVHKSAVVRNRIRRRIYEVVRMNEPRMTRPYDMVITVFTDQTATMSASDLQEVVVDQLTRVGIIEAKPASNGHDIVMSKERQL